MNKFFLVCGLILTLAACAKPTYVSTIGKPPAGKDGDETEAPKCQAHFQKSNLCVTIDWETPPTGTTVGKFLFKVYRPNEGDDSPMPVDLAGTMNVRLFMPAMGHGSSPIAVEQLDTGTYSASNVFFSMHGDWQLIFETKQKTGTVVDKAILPYTY